MNMKVFNRFFVFKTVKNGINTKKNSEPITGFFKNCSHLFLFIYNFRVMTYGTGHTNAIPFLFRSISFCAQALWLIARAFSERCSINITIISNSIDNIELNLFESMLRKLNMGVNDHPAQKTISTKKLLSSNLMV